jgi:hypothetical protein
LYLARQQLVEAMRNFQVPPLHAVDVSPWVGMALLQKAVRRGREDLALQAAATLLSRSPENLWRRCGGIAFEDVGLGDLETLAIVTAALVGKRFRATLGGEWPVAAFIVSRMAASNKCRSADDLLMTAELHPDFAGIRAEYATLSTSELLRIVKSPAPLPERAVALWYSIGTGWRRSQHLQARRGDPKAVFDALSQIDHTTDVVEIATAGYRKLAETLCPLVALLQPLRTRESAVVEDDSLPPEVTVRGVPGWAYDAYSREGRGALSAFLNGSSETARWISEHVPAAKRIGVLGGIVFRVEGGLVRRRLRWPTADSLRAMVDLGTHGLDGPDAAEVLELMRRDIPYLNEVRSHVC